MVWKIFPLKSWLQGGCVTWVILCFAKKLCTRHDAWAICCHNEGANHQLPVAVALCIIQIVSTEDYSSKISCRWVALFTRSFWMGWTHSTHAHLAASSTPTDQHSEVVIVHKCTVQSSPLSLAARLHDIAQIVLIILTMAWLFPDGPRIHQRSFLKHMSTFICNLLTLWFSWPSFCVRPEIHT